MKLIRLFLIVIAAQSGAIAQNIQINAVGNPNEPSIMINPDHPNLMVAGSNLNYYYASNDSGHTWTTNTLTSPYGVWGDPVIDIDTAGNFYFFHLSNSAETEWIDRIVCQKSIDNGATWNTGTFTGLDGSKANDKEWSVIDRETNTIYLTWTQFDDYGSTNPLDSTIILFSKSMDEGETWASPTRINKFAGNCIDSDSTVMGAVPAVGPLGQIYVAWAGPNGIVFNRSMDAGETWLPEETIIDPMPGGWNYDIPGISRANGLPIIKCDLSGGPNHGTIYINWSDQRNGITDTDVWLVKSADGGDTWSPPIRVNNDATTTHQFFTWMDIDQIDGTLYFAFYDRRNYTDNQTDVYLSFSVDGGESFNDNRVSETPFIPNDGIFFGDYLNVSAHNGVIRPIWTRMDGAALSIWTELTPLIEDFSTIKNETEGMNEISTYPNPTSDISYISFKLHEAAMIRIEIYDQAGKIIKTLIDREEMNYGKHIIPIDTKQLGLSPGIYSYRLVINDELETSKQLIVE